MGREITPTKRFSEHQRGGEVLYLKVKRALSLLDGPRA